MVEESEDRLTDEDVTALIQVITDHLDPEDQVAE